MTIHINKFRKVQNLSPSIMIILFYFVEFSSQDEMESYLQEEWNNLIERVN